MHDDGYISSRGPVHENEFPCPEWRRWVGHGQPCTCELYLHEKSAEYEAYQKLLASRGWATIVCEHRPYEPKNEVLGRVTLDAQRKQCKGDSRPAPGPWQLTRVQVIVERL